MSVDGQPATAELDLGEGLTISGKAMIGADDGAITVGLSSLVLRYTPPLAPPPGGDLPAMDSLVFTAPVHSLAGMPILSAQLLDATDEPLTVTAENNRIRVILPASMTGTETATAVFAHRARSA